MELISITERLPEVNQDVIAFNGQKLVAAKYIERLFLIDIKTMTTERRGVFDVEKYISAGDRTMTTTWSGITHWMPAKIDTPK